MQLGTSAGVFTNWGATLFSYFNVNVSGKYTFHVASDNGAQLYLNSTLLIDNSRKSNLFCVWQPHARSHMFRAMHYVATWLLLSRHGKLYVALFCLYCTALLLKQVLAFCTAHAQEMSCMLLAMMSCKMANSPADHSLPC